MCMAFYQHFIEHTIDKTDEWLLIVATVCSFIFTINTIAKIVLIFILKRTINDEKGHNII